MDYALGNRLMETIDGIIKTLQKTLLNVQFGFYYGKAGILKEVKGIGQFQMPISTEGTADNYFLKMN